MELWERYLAIYAEAIRTHCEKPLGFISEPVNTSLVEKIKQIVSHYS